jgi:hypothetical protein
VPAPFTCNLRDPDGAEREIVYSTLAVEVAGSPHLVAIFDDLTGPRAAGRAAVGLAQAASQLVRAGSTDEILAGIARHAVEGTRAVACGVVVMGDDHKLVSGGGYGPGGPDYGEASPAWNALAASNRQIAQTLVISERTARTHVSAILSKLGLVSRTQVALWAVREGLTPSPADRS